MAISKYACYIYDSGKHLLKQGSLTYNSANGKYTFSNTLANINQGEINETQIVVAVPDGSYDSYFPYITVKAPQGWTTQPLSMVKADITIIEGGVETVYQVATIDLSLVGLTRYAGVHVFVVGWLTNGTYVTLDGAKYTVDDGVNNYEDIEADNYIDIYASLELTFTAYADRVIAIENFITGGLGYVSGQTNGIRTLTLYSASGNVVITTDGTKVTVNIGGVDYYYAIKNADNTFSELNTFVKQITAQAGIELSNTKITGLANGTVATDAINKAQHDLKADKTYVDSQNSALNSRVTENENDIANLENANMIKSITRTGTNLITITYYNNATATVISLAELKAFIGEATNAISGLMTAQHVTDLETLMALFESDSDTVVNTIAEVLAIFAQYPEGVDLVTALAGKVNTTDIVNDLTTGGATKVLSAEQGKQLNIAVNELDSEKIDKDFSDYVELAAEDIVDDDYIIVRDVSTNTTKKTKVSTINNYIGDTYEYGVRRVYAPTMQTSSVLERVMKINGELIVGAATGLEFNVGIDGQVVTNSFDNIDIFKTKEVVINGNVFIQFQRRFTKHEYVADGETTHEYWWQCDKKLTGYSSVVFDRYGAGESDYAYIGKYKMVDIGGVGKSAAGYYPDNSLTMDAARTKARKNDGDGTNTNSKYGLVDRAERYELIEVPFYIITATLHSQSVLVGVTNLTFDANTVADSTVNNTAIVANASATLFKTDMCIYLSTDSKYHVITAIDVDTPAAGQTTITFDGDTVLPLTGANLDPRAYKTGLTTGVKASFGAYRANDGYNPITILGLEDIYGGMWEGVDGVKVNDWYPFFNTDPTTYSNAASIGGLYANYTKADFQMPNANGYSKDMGFDDRFSNLPMPIEVGGNNVTYYADYFYQASGDRMVLVGGSWDNTSFAGLTYWFAYYTLTYALSSIGFRLSYRPQRGSRGKLPHWVLMFQKIYGGYTMKAQSNIKPDTFTLNDLGKKKEIILCENITEFTNDGGLFYEYDMTLVTALINNRDDLIVALVRCKYSIDDEFAVLNKGIADNTNTEYIAYRDYVTWCKEQASVYFS